MSARLLIRHDFPNGPVPTRDATTVALRLVLESLFRALDRRLAGIHRAGRSAGDARPRRSRSADAPALLSSAAADSRFRCARRVSSNSARQGTSPQAYFRMTKLLSVQLNQGGGGASHRPRRVVRRDQQPRCARRPGDGYRSIRPHVVFDVGHENIHQPPLQKGRRTPHRIDALREAVGMGAAALTRARSSAWVWATGSSYQYSRASANAGPLASPRARPYARGNPPAIPPRRRWRRARHRRAPRPCARRLRAVRTVVQARAARRTAPV